MLNELDSLLQQREIDALFVPMHEAMHPAFRWLSRGAKVTRGYAIKLRGRDPVLVTYPMERGEAAATGLQVLLAHEFDHDRLFRDAADPVEGYADFFTAVLRHLGAGPSIAVLGNAPLQLYLGIAPAMERRGWKIHQTRGEDLLQIARKRKDPREIEAIRSVGERTEQVVDSVRALLRNTTVHNGIVQHDGTALTLGALKRLVSSEIVRLGMIEDHDTILSQGRDAAVPHSRGNAAAVVRASQTIVLDIFPVDRDTGYFFDLTRTFVVGPIPEDVASIHAQVYEAFTRARDAVRPGTEAKTYQAMTCDFFEAKGYPTLRSDPRTTSGYVHGLGHGVGLEIHEKPSFHLTAVNRDTVEPGDILTIEPGLYFPEREIGVRIEDTFLVTDTGVETLCRGSYGLEP